MKSASRMSYVPGERAMMKVKRIRTAYCVMGGFRHGTHRRQAGLLLLGLHDEAEHLNHIGFTSSIKAAQRPALTRQLEALVAPPGFTGSAPGGASRWSTGRSGAWIPLRPELVVAVGFDHVTTTDSDMVRPCFAGTPTSRRVSARSNRSRRRNNGLTCT